MTSPCCSSRRAFLQSASCGFGSLAMAGLFAAPAARATSALSPKPPHFQPRARRVIFLYMQGGPSQVDLFDPKPRLIRDHGQTIPFAIPSDMAEDGIENSKLMRPVAAVRRRGSSGMWWSDLLPCLAERVDDICLLNGMQADNPAHPPASMQIQTGYTQGAHPALGSWVSYGLGTENANLPGFVTIAPLMTGDAGGPHLFHSAYLPAIHQGMAVADAPATAEAMRAKPPINYLERTDLPRSRQRAQLELVESMNRGLMQRLEVDALAEGMIESFELAFRMQREAPELVDLARESQATRRLYGIGEKETDALGRRLLLARRMLEAGVRFVQVTHPGWDNHGNIRRALPGVCRAVDRPIAALLTDLKMRGLLDDTLVIWTGEFGRSPYDQDISRGKDAKDNYGRGHNPYGFSAWLAGGGVRGGLTYGATDEYGYRAVEGRTHVHDLHATVLHLLGLDHEQLTYRHAGRDFRMTDVYGSVVQEILA